MVSDPADLQSEPEPEKLEMWLRPSSCERMNELQWTDEWINELGSVLGDKIDDDEQPTLL
jgi:hypothetical protein